MRIDHAHMIATHFLAAIATARPLCCCSYTAGLCLLIRLKQGRFGCELRFQRVSIAVGKPKSVPGWCCKQIMKNSSEIGFSGFDAASATRKPIGDGDLPRTSWRQSSVWQPDTPRDRNRHPPSLRQEPIVIGFCRRKLRYCCCRLRGKTIRTREQRTSGGGGVGGNWHR